MSGAEPCIGAAILLVIIGLMVLMHRGGGDSLPDDTVRDRRRLRGVAGIAEAAVLAEQHRTGRNRDVAAHVVVTDRDIPELDATVLGYLNWLLDPRNTRGTHVTVEDQRTQRAMREHEQRRERGKEIVRRQ